jgi:hypothetical protein
VHPARQLWQVLEPLHDVVYFAPGVRAAGTAIGLKGFWDTYFAFRAAPLGPVGAGGVTAAFANFAPAMVARALPGAWTRATPETCLRARSAVSTGALRELGVEAGPAAQAVALLGPVAAAADPTGRPLFAGNAEVPLPDDPVAALWQVATTLREHRGDGHVAALVAQGVTGLQAHVLQSARGRFSPEEILSVRGWDAQDWESAATALTGLVSDGALTPAGTELLDRVEQQTDDLAWSGGLRSLGEDGVAQAVTLLTPYAGLVHESGLLPLHNPTGLSRPG